MSAGLVEPLGHKKRVWPVVLFVFIIMGAGGGYYYYVYSWPYVLTDNAFIEASVVRVSPQVSGQVLSVLVEDNQEVKAGDLLVELDPKPFQVKLDADVAQQHVAESRQRAAAVNVELVKVTTQANIEQAQAEVDAAKAMVDQAHAEAGAAEAEAKRAETDARRYDSIGESAISQQKRDLANVGARVADARLTEARKQIVAAEAKVAVAMGHLAQARTAPQQVAVSESQVDQAAAGVEQAQAAVRGSELSLSYTRVFAPVSGRIARKSVRVGETVQAGQALMAVVPDEVWVVANFKETQLRRMRVGQAVEIRVDAYPDIKLNGRVQSIQPGSGARFSLLPPENATGNYVKVIQRVPVKIVFDEQPPAERMIAPGMSVTPKVRVR